MPPLSASRRGTCRQVKATLDLTLSHSPGRGLWPDRKHANMCSCSYRRWYRLHVLVRRPTHPRHLALIAPRPDFDSPSVFARMLDKDKGGHFAIGPAGGHLWTTKQHYLPSSNILQTRHLHENGVMNVVDFFPRPNDKANDAEYHQKVVHGKQRGEMLNERDERVDLKKWLVRRVECLRGEVDVDIQLFPAFSKCIASPILRGLFIVHLILHALSRLMGTRLLGVCAYLNRLRTGQAHDRNYQSGRCTSKDYVQIQKPYVRALCNDR